MRTNHNLKKLLLCLSFGLLLSQLAVSQSSATDSLKLPFDHDYLHRLVKYDSLYKTFDILNRALIKAQVQEDMFAEAVVENHLGYVYQEISNFNMSQRHYISAIKIFEKLGDDKRLDESLKSLAKTYMLSHKYDKFDSIYPIAQNLSRKINSESRFYNYSSKLEVYYKRFRIRDTRLLSDKIIKEITSTNFDSLNISQEPEQANLKKALTLDYRIYNSFAYFIDTSDSLKKIGFERLVAIPNDTLIHYLVRDQLYFSKLSLLNYYKSQYYQDNGQLEKAVYHMDLSDSFKYRSILIYEKRLAEASDLGMDVVDTMNELKRTKEQLNYDNAIKRVYLIVIVITSVLLVVVSYFLVYYNRSRAKIKSINSTLRESNKKLLIVDRERFEFFSILSHELRTPIYGINGLTALIEDETDVNKQKKLFHTLKLSTKYIAMLIDNVLQASRFKFEKKNIQLEPFNFEDLIVNIYQTTNVFAEDKQLHLHLNFDKRLKNQWLLLDRVALNQVLINLIYNAVKFTPPDKNIYIKVKESFRSNDIVSIYFEVKDEGSGIKNENQSKIFSAFENPTDFTSNKGTGLGLHIVKKLIESHNSQIKFRSEVGIGTTFYFTVDFAIVEGRSMHDSSDAAFIEKPLKALVVDDNKLNLLITTKNLQRLGNITCHTASSGREAIELLKESYFDLILMDINMPGLNGYETSKIMLQHRKDSTIIALTALNYNEVIDLAKSSGLSDVITKPYNPVDFKRIILNNIKRSKTKNTIFSS